MYCHAVLSGSYNYYIALLFDMQDVVKSGENTINVDFEVSGYKLSHILSDHIICHLHGSQLLITLTRQRLSIPTKYLVAAATLTFLHETLSARHSLILGGTGDLLLFQWEYGKISGTESCLDWNLDIENQSLRCWPLHHRTFVWFTHNMMWSHALHVYSTSALLLLLMSMSHTWSPRQVTMSHPSPFTSLSLSASSFQNQRVLTSLWSHSCFSITALISLFARFIKS